MKTAVTIEFDLGALGSYADSFLAQLWHVAQANPADISDRNAGDIAERIGREIVKRWLAAVPPELWAHQGLHHHACARIDERHYSLATKGPL